MHIAVVGVGNLGAAVAFELLHYPKVNKITLVETFQPSFKKMVGEYWDLAPVARAAGISLSKMNKLPTEFDAAIITAGVPRKSTKDDKNALFATNLPIVVGILSCFPEKSKAFIATNPPNDLAKWAVEKGYDAIPLRACTDDLRSAMGDCKAINSHVLDNKGTTQWTAAYAICKEVMSKLKLAKRARRDIEDLI